MEHLYQLTDTDQIVSPALVYYKDLIQQNIKEAIRTAGDAGRLWPHVKTHKMAGMVELMMAEGIRRFKCATIAEAEMAASCGAGNVLLAYPLIGPDIPRFLQLQEAFPSVCFWVIGDHLEALQELGRLSPEAGAGTQVLVDVNMGMNRTGVEISHLREFFVCCSEIPGITLMGLHCYDGHRTEKKYDERKEAAMSVFSEIIAVMASLKEAGLNCPVIVVGGSPSFPCYTDLSAVYYSPGTLFVHDYGYSLKFPDLNYTPGAAILTRVISCPKEGYFTLDLGYKGIAADPAGTRGVIIGLEHTEEVFQSEEHWTFCMESGYEADCPRPGDVLHVIPTHICPTSALYPEVPVASHGKIDGIWQVTARNRKITY